MTLGNASCRYGSRVMFFVCVFFFFWSNIVIVHLGSDKFGVKNCLDQHSMNK